jgi:hypothetical protein
MRPGGEEPEEGLVQQTTGEDLLILLGERWVEERQQQLGKDGELSLGLGGEEPEE